MVQKFSWNKLKKPFFTLAPMAGISNQPFRLICKCFGVDVLFSEMISSEAIWHGKKLTANSRQSRRKLVGTPIKKASGPSVKLLKTLELIKFSQKERPFIVQIFGANPEHMAYAAKYIASGEWARDYNKLLAISQQPLAKSIPDGIDINMGCPVRDITKTGSGAALMKNPKLASRIIKAVKKSINIPLSVKTRLGWNDDKNILIFSRMLADSGADAITIHGRTVKQGFTGEVNWQKIAEVKKHLPIPVIGNGGLNFVQDVSNVPNVASAITTNKMIERAERLNIYNSLDGYMVGRGARGNPWLFAQGKRQNEKGKIISLAERKKIILEHAKLVYQLQSERGIIELRKHLAWYFTGVANSAKIRSMLVKVNDLKDIIKILKL